MCAYSGVVIGFAEREVTVSESDGTVQLVLVKDSDTVRDYLLEIRLLPLTAGEYMYTVVI